MASIYETGHAKNAANLETLINFCLSYGTAYNPAKLGIKITTLNTILAEAKAALSDVIEKSTAFTVAVNIRQATFADIKALSTKLINALSVTDALEKTISDAKGINRKIQGTRAAKKSTITVENEEAVSIDEKSVSASQQSYDQQIEHFTKLIVLLENEIKYIPNEPELQVSSLKYKLANMKAANLSLNKAYVDLSNSRLNRNRLLYSKDTGLCKTAQEVKKYIKSVFGAISPQFKQVSKIIFRVIR